jgi:probable rRNA maturation factor
MIRINVIINHEKWSHYIKTPNRYIDKKVKKLNLKTKIFKKKIINCTLLLSGNKEIKKLNKRFRKKNKSTDVLSFPFYTKKDLVKIIKDENEIYLGDIIVNLNQLIGKKNQKFSFYEFDKIWVHGLVHLLGHDHKNERDFKAMNKLEKKYLEHIK